MKPERSQSIDREREALELRKIGATYGEIARAVGYSGRSAAYKAVKRALDATIREPAEELRRLECLRLDALQCALWPAAMAGRASAIDRVLSIMDRRAKLLGLDAPRREVVHVITEDAVDREIRRLEVQLAENDGAD